ncbi:hypothetical protein [Stieleria mannarensis]|uniref:glycoside hydrolase family 78 protein n=1 Tax=Stieleria mannarensis TaxID=2755585 RepID=UPI0015FFEF6A|nr:hypothetical protein [Rhodopirellula sp. JC639]
MHRISGLAILPAVCLFFLGSTSGDAAPPRPHSLTVGERFTDPVGFYDPTPVFSWKLPVVEGVQSQTAYRIAVLDGEGENSQQTLWDSGKVDSDQSVWVPYGGPALTSRRRGVR